MSDTISIPTELLKDIVDVNNRLVEINNRLQACQTRSTASDGDTDTSQKGGKDRPNLPSKKAILENRMKKYVDNTLHSCNPYS